MAPPEEITREVGLTAALLDPCFGGCVMCAIAAGFHDAELVVRSTREALVVLDRFAASRGHLLVVLRKHEEHLAALGWPEWQALQRLAWEASRALEAVLAPRRIYVASLGSSTAIGKSFPHLHLQVVPLHEDGEAARPAHVFSWSRGIGVYEKAEAAALVAELAGAWPAEG